MIKLTGIVILAAFYAVYLGKMALQKRQGIQTDQIARGKPRDRVFYIELVMKLATYSAVAAQAVSIFTVPPALPRPVIWLGAALGVAGDGIFFTAVYTMRDSWRAGIARQDKTKLVTAGIYRWSRNPAFLAFDLTYLGLTLMFFNWPLALLSTFAAVMLHLQILQEEAYLPEAFGQAYLDYKSRVRRYLGRK